MSRFPDHFSAGADDYARYRPRYPDALFSTLAGLAPARHLAWDCATGNGQAAAALAEHFERVIASDASASQIARGLRHERVDYLVAPAEKPGLTRHSVDLLTVAQALHWFDLPAFYAAVRDIVRPGGLIAAWTYVLLDITPQINTAVRHLHHDVLGTWWPAQRRHVDNGYRDLPFPFTPVTLPAFTMTARWTLYDLFGYLQTWSATSRYHAELGEDPVDMIRDSLYAAWGDPDLRREVRWPLRILAGRN